MTAGTGPADTDCVGAPEGCAYVFDSRTLRCREQCDANEAPDRNNVCTCMGFRSNASGACVGCHSECRDGCFDDTSASCVSCRAFQYQGTCVARCPSNSLADGNGICLPCDDRCFNGCSKSADASRCSGARRCRAFWDGATCSDTCPSSKGFVVNCSDSASENVNECVNTLDLVCLMECPATFPFFNDTREISSGVPLHPQLCAISCTQIEVNGTVSHTLGITRVPDCVSDV